MKKLILLSLIFLSTLVHADLRRGDGADVPVGTVITFAGANCPTGFLKTDGSSYLKVTYPKLFTAIGVAHGTSGSSFFNVPDYRGMFLRGVSNGSTNDPDKLTRTVMNIGGNTGDNVGSIQADGVIAHTHNYTSNATGTLGTNGSGPATLYVANTNAGVTTAQGGSETRPKNAYVNFCIKY